MRLLLINANTTTAVTDFCVAAARRFARADTVVTGLTGRFGAEIVTSRAQNIVAGHALLDLVAEHAGDADCILIAVSFDTALLAAREISPVPVIGMTEAALRSAAFMGRRIGLVSFSTPDLYMELAAHYGMGDQIAGIVVLELDPRLAYVDPSAVRAATEAAAHKLVLEHSADCVVLCGAVMAGMSQELSAMTVPVFDGIRSGVAVCEAIALQT